MDFVVFWSGIINIVEVCMEYVLSGSCQQITSSERCRNCIYKYLIKEAKFDCILSCCFCVEFVCVIVYFSNGLVW